MMTTHASRLFAAITLCTIAGCATPKIDTRTHYLNETSAPKHAVPITPAATPSAPAAPKLKKHKAPAQRHSSPEPALDTDAAGSPMLHLRSTPPTLRDRTGAPVPIVPSSRVTPPAPTPVASTESAAPAPGLAGVGDFEIQYVNGVITKVSIRKKTGKRDLDRKSKEWILAKFRVRPGATGQSSLTLTWREDRDRPTPQFHSL